MKNLKSPTHTVHHDLHFLLQLQTNFSTLQHEPSLAKRLSEQKPETNGVCSFFLLLFFASWKLTGLVWPAGRQGEPISSSAGEPVLLAPAENKEGGGEETGTRKMLV